MRRFNLRPMIISISIGAAWLATGALGQRIRVEEVEELTRPVVVDGATRAREGDNLPEEAMIEQIVSSEVPQATSIPEISGIPQVDVDPPFSNTQEGSPQPTESVVPISVLLFAGSPGPKDCRGNVMVNIQLPKPGSQHSIPKCYNVPGISQCGTFVGNMDDGCQARLFNEPNCLTFANLAVFTPEQRAVGGVFRSIEITCGIKGETPPPLNLPGIQLPPNAQQAVGKVNSQSNIPDIEVQATDYCSEPHWSGT
ncbi:hypothetical protein F4821DRAFT_189506 [Hypoxylon rubiginosum]|uniref:Uncharacterized protein n=1 Tax=Hypoxylon rubiginosum TaxID=110542 RepID=A0ACC0DFP9_9PEZI|nr:hypothetical protein F4821DRAFT_189506 [Hypoxylon rubiginosum]